MLPFAEALRGRVSLQLLERLAKVNPKQRIFVSHAHDFLRSALQESADPTIGLKASASAQNTSVGLFDFIMKSSDSPRAATAASARYIRLLSDVHALSLGTHRRQAVIRIDTSLPVPDVLEDFVLASLVRNHVVEWCGGDLEETEVWFRHAEPADLAPYLRALPLASLRFGADISGFSFRIDRLDAPLRARDRRLHAVLCAAAERILSALPAYASTTDSVRERIEQRLATHDIKLSLIADELELHPRHLYRALAREGTSFDALLDDERRRVSLSRVAATNTPFLAVARQAGFGSVPAFYRAFRRWTGRTPAAYRRLHRLSEDAAQR